MTPGPVSKPQGRDDVVVDAPSEILWDLISDSRLLARWGPPVAGVEVFVDEGEPERIGSLRKVYARFGRRSGWFLERRVEHVEGRAIAFVIEEDTFGLSRLVERSGASLELLPLPAGRTRVVFAFFHDPRGVKGRLVNPLLRWKQRRNRLAALASLKRHAEAMAAHRH
jgi:Polyketide cyclase / dehydrase and lipid transport